MRDHLQALRACRLRVNAGRRIPNGQDRPSTILPLLSRSRSTLHAFTRHGRYGATRLQSTAPACARQQRTGGVLVAVLHVLKYDMYSIWCIRCSRGQDHWEGLFLIR